MHIERNKQQMFILTTSFTWANAANTHIHLLITLIKIKHHFHGGVAWPVVHTPFPWLHPRVKTVPHSETRRNVKRKGENGITSSNLTETQNKSSIANKLEDMAMKNIYCIIIDLALFHLYFAILYLCLLNLFSYCNTSYSFAYICGIKLIP